MKKLPLFLSAGLLCAGGLAIGCEDKSTPAASDAGVQTPEVQETSWVDDASVTKAHVKVTGMT
ncbi:MAG: hypothetical protein ACIAXF_16720 [Phycisphaerales bacterium JB063]